MKITVPDQWYTEGIQGKGYQNYPKVKYLADEVQVCFSVSVNSLGGYNRKELFVLYHLLNVMLFHTILSATSQH